MDITEHIAARIDLLMKAQDDAMACMRRALWDTGVTFSAARQGGWGVQWNGKQLDSNYNPGKAAIAFLKTFKHDGSKLVILLGAGGGSLPLALAERLKPTNATLLVYEPNASILLGLFTFNTDVDRLDPARVQCCCEPDSVRNVLLHHPHARDGFQVLCAPAYTHAMPQEIAAFRTLCEETARMRVATQVTRTTLTQTWLRNLIANLPQRTRLPSFFTLTDALSDVPAVLAGSGPGLDENIDCLRRHADKLFILAANSSFKALVRNGIVPHLVFAVEVADLSADLDPSDLPKNQRPALVLSETCRPDAFNLPFPRIFQLPQTHLSYGPFIRTVTGEPFQGLAQGASVSNLMLSAALTMGCRPIAMIGQDLAFTDNKAYAAVTDYGELHLERIGSKGRLIDDSDALADLLEEDNRPRYSLEHQLHEVTDWHQRGTVITTPGFDLIRRCFEEEAKRVGNSVRLVNATESGAYVAGFEHQSLAQFCDRLQTEPVVGHIRAALAKAWEQGRRVGPLRIKDGFAQTRSAVARQAADAQTTLEMLELLAAVLDKQGPKSLAFAEARQAYTHAEKRISKHCLVTLWTEAALLALARTPRGDGMEGVFDRARDTLGIMIEGCRQVNQLLHDAGQ